MEEPRLLLRASPNPESRSGNSGARASACPASVPNLWTLCTHFEPLSTLLHPSVPLWTLPLILYKNQANPPHDPREESSFVGKIFQPVSSQGYRDFICFKHEWKFSILNICQATLAPSSNSLFSSFLSLRETRENKFVFMYIYKSQKIQIHNSTNFKVCALKIGACHDFSFSLH